MTGHEQNRMRSVVKVVLLLCIVAVAVVSMQAGEGDELAFPLKRVSVFDLPENARREFLIGQRAICRDEADPNVTAYPQLKSAQPIYGTVDFGDPLGGKEARTVYCFAVDESAGTDQGYDRLYFDLNHDRDLTNDSALTVRKDPPEGAMLNYSDVKQQACFENLAIPLPCGGDERPLEMMPRLMVSNNGYKMLSLVTTRACKGRIKLAGQNCDVLLGHCYIASGWFDKPWTALHLTPAGGTRRWDWWGGDRLNAMHKIGGALYTFSATPTGDKLIVRPYEGPFGTFEVGAGGRNIDRFEITGSLRSEKTAVAVGEITNASRPQSTRSCRLPVGDYLPEFVTLDYGTLRISISNNYHTDGRRRDTQNRQWVYGIHIREDKPFVFDFSNKPAVMFASPARDHRIKVGEELSVMAVLIDPALDFMIRGLSDTRRKQQRESTGPDGTKHSYTQDLSLDPKVTIARANGEMVAEGVMPFG